MRIAMPFVDNAGYCTSNSTCDKMEEITNTYSKYMRQQGIKSSKVKLFIIDSTRNMKIETK